MKKTFIPPILFLLIVLISCGKSENVQTTNEKNKISTISAEKLAYRQNLRKKMGMIGIKMMSGIRTA